MILKIIPYLSLSVVHKMLKIHDILKENPKTFFVFVLQCIQKLIIDYNCLKKCRLISNILKIHDKNLFNPIYSQIKI